MLFKVRVTGKSAIVVHQTSCTPCCLGSAAFEDEADELLQMQLEHNLMLAPQYLGPRWEETVRDMRVIADGWGVSM